MRGEISKRAFELNDGHGSERGASSLCVQSKGDLHLVRRLLLLINVEVESVTHLDFRLAHSATTTGSRRRHGGSMAAAMPLRFGQTSSKGRYWSVVIREDDVGSSK